MIVGQTMASLAGGVIVGVAWPAAGRDGARKAVLFAKPFTAPFRPYKWVEDGHGQ
jgi:hypothetical protein